MNKTMYNQFQKLFIPCVLQDKKEKKQYRRQVSITVLSLFVIGSILNLPFSRAVKKINIEAGNTKVNLNESIFTDIITIGFSSLIVGAIAVFIGLWVSSRTNLGAPLIARFFSKKPIREIIKRDAIISSVVLAAIVSIILLGFFEIQKEFYPVAHKLSRPSKPYYALVSFSAGITEEILFRLGLMSWIISGIQFLKKIELPTNKMVWTGILVSALFFGLFHLPLSTNFVELTPFTIGVTMIGNCITGTTFGWIFWKRGLLVAILSHITFDLVFHVIGSPFT
jgi:membrane protease YdiL (CAAX protease family)